MKHLLRTSALLVALAAPAYAQIINGNFASALAGWSASGDASARDGAGFVTTASLSGDDDNLGTGFHNFSGSEVSFASDLETALGLPADALSPDANGGVFAFEGSALFQSVTVQAGDVLSFDWTLFSKEAAGTDYAFVVIDGTAFNLSTGSSLSVGSTYDYGFTSGSQSFQSAPFASAGTFTIGIGVVDVDNFVSSSAVSFDNVALAAIPEPSAFAALAGLATLALATTRRRRRA
jgi:hypothetical protein